MAEKREILAAIESACEQSLQMDRDARDLDLAGYNDLDHVEAESGCSNR